MSTVELQNIIIRKILNINETEVLQKMDELLDQINQHKPEELSELEKRFVKTGLQQIKNGRYHTNEEVFVKTGAWLEK